MIACIQGQLTYQSPGLLIIETAGGIGYEVHISLATYERVKACSQCKLFTYLHITQEAHLLYGFSEVEEKRWFLHLLGVNGVGPRMAITILSSLSPQALQRAIIDQHSATLQTIKGIGTKVAQRIILELHSKVDKQAIGTPWQQDDEQAAMYDAALAALVTLGIPKAIAEKKLTTLLKTQEKGFTVEKLIKLALQS